MFKRADGYWVAGVQLPPGPDGKRRYKRIIRKSRNDAITELRRLRGDVAAGKVVNAPTVTVGRWLEYWRDDILPHRQIGGQPLKHTTLDDYEKAIRNYLIPHLGARRLDKLTPADIRSMYVALTEMASGRTAQKADQVLRLAVKAALREGVLTVNVMDRVDKPTYLKTEAQAFNARTAMHIIATAERTQGPMWGARWAFGFLTGARESEVLGMEWDRVDFAGQTVNVSWQLQRMKRKHGCGEPVNGKFPCGFNRPAYCPDGNWKYPRGDFRQCSNTICWTRPKTKAGKRVIPLLPELGSILKRIEDAGPNPHNLLFHHPDGRPFDQEQDQKAWRQLLKDAGLPHFRQHTIRNSTATLLLEAGVDVHIIMSVIGHTDIATTRGYQHVDLELARRAWSNLSSVLPKALEDVGGSD